jgi:predicted nucleic acid-binding protein
VILVDTSVWIRFLAGREPYAAELDRLLALNDVLGHDLIYGELLIGDRGGRPKLLELYAALTPSAVIAHSEVVTFVKHRKLHGRGIGWVDAHLLASAVADHATLWTADSTLDAIAGELGIGHAAV